MIKRGKDKRKMVAACRCCQAVKDFRRSLLAERRGEGAEDEERERERETETEKKRRRKKQEGRETSVVTNVILARQTGWSKDAYQSQGCVRWKLMRKNNGHPSVPECLANV